jgi:hypothetical protein
MRTIVLDVEPFGHLEIEIRGAIVAGGESDPGTRARIFAEVKSNPFVPVVRVNAIQARAFGYALLEVADALERAMEGIR